MKIEHYHDFLSYQSQGLKEKATETITKFINSFENDEEKELWVLEYLPKFEPNIYGTLRLRHELFEEIVFPVLLAGYNNKNVELMLWLAKLCQNLYQNEKIWEKINFKPEAVIIEECYNLDPDNEVIREKLLGLKIYQIDYHIHEWPAGILYGHNGATIDECNILLDEIPLIRKLDTNKEHQEFIQDYEDKIKEYMERMEVKWGLKQSFP